MKIVGYQKIDFVPNGQNTPIKFGRIFVSYPIENNGKGIRFDQFKCTLDFLKEVESIPLNSDVELYFDKYKRVAKIDVVK